MTQIASKMDMSLDDLIKKSRTETKKSKGKPAANNQGQSKQQPRKKQGAEKGVKVVGNQNKQGKQQQTGKNRAQATAKAVTAKASSNRQAKLAKGRGVAPPPQGRGGKRPPAGARPPQPQKQQQQRRPARGNQTRPGNQFKPATTPVKGMKIVVNQSPKNKQRPKPAQQAVRMPGIQQPSGKPGKNAAGRPIMPGTAIANKKAAQLAKGPRPTQAPGKPAKHPANLGVQGGIRKGGGAGGAKQGNRGQRPGGVGMKKGGGNTQGGIGMKVTSKGGGGGTLSERFSMLAKGRR